MPTPVSRTSPAQPRPPAPSAGVRVVADIGATNARFAVLGSGPLELDRIECFPCADHAGLEDALRTYMAEHDLEAVSEVCLAVAAPVEHDVLSLPNNHWSFSRHELEGRLGAPVAVINDFTAQALGIDALGPEDIQWLGAPRPTGVGTRTVLGPGTGLGVAIRTPGGEILGSEGGHVSFAPTNAHEIEILRILLDRYGRVSAERLLSGPGLENLYQANRQIHLGGVRPDAGVPRAEEIARMAAADEPIAQRSVRDFLDILAAVAGDMALVTWATGGVYLSGGVVRKLSRFLDGERFRSRFQAKGRFEGFCSRVPLAWISHGHPGLLGCAVALAGSPQPREVA